MVVLRRRPCCAMLLVRGATEEGTPQPRLLPVLVFASSSEQPSGSAGFANGSQAFPRCLRSGGRARYSRIAHTRLAGRLGEWGQHHDGLSCSLWSRLPWAKLGWWRCRGQRENLSMSELARQRIVTPDVFPAPPRLAMHSGCCSWCTKRASRGKRCSKPEINLVL